MTKRQFILTVIIASLFGGLVAYAIVMNTLEENSNYNTVSTNQSISEKQQVSFANLPSNINYEVPEGLNFIESAAQVVGGVVHIRALSDGSNNVQSILSPRGNPGLSSGSGVIISPDGFIVTNNHVVDNASEIEVILYDNRSYEAEIIGTDPSTDLALIKVDERNLDFIKYGNSDDVKIGQWVLAVGNPFNLTSTVTAGIVSAKARNIGILRVENSLQIESFIQTDAAVNPGNSGGALVNLYGQLIGVNTAIATQTGSYSGYSFAIPVTLVKKVMDDLLEFGKVQRGLLGIRIADVNARLAEIEDLSVVKGVYVSQVNSNSAAEQAGIEPGDVIIKIDEVSVNNVAELQEIVARNRPGDKVTVHFIRNGKEKQTGAVLRNVDGNTTLSRRR